MAKKLVEGGIRETHELDLGHRMQAIGRHADGRADDARFGKGGVDHPLGAKTIQQPLGDSEYTAVPGYILTEDHDPVVLRHLLAQDEVDGLYHVELRHVRPPPAVRPAVE